MRRLLRFVAAAATALIDAWDETKPSRPVQWISRDTRYSRRAAERRREKLQSDQVRCQRVQELLWLETPLSDFSDPLDLETAEMLLGIGPS